MQRGFLFYHEFNVVSHEKRGAIPLEIKYCKNETQTEKNLTQFFS